MSWPDLVQDVSGATFKVGPHPAGPFGYMQEPLPGKCNKVLKSTLGISPDGEVVSERRARWELAHDPAAMWRPATKRCRSDATEASGHCLVHDPDRIRQRRVERVAESQRRAVAEELTAERRRRRSERSNPVDPWTIVTMTWAEVLTVKYVADALIDVNR